MRDNDEKKTVAPRSSWRRLAVGAASLVALGLAPSTLRAADKATAPAPTTVAQATPTDPPAGVAPAPVLEQAPAPPAPPVETHRIGAHVGVATPLVTVSKSTTTISDQFTVLNPIGLGFKLTPELAIDFEFVVGTPVHPMTGTTSILVDPGVVYNWGAFATGLRVAWAVEQNANIGLIPLVNVPLVRGEAATWFVEAAFPTFLRHVDPTDTTDGKVAFNAVFHTGVGF